MHELEPLPPVTKPLTQEQLDRLCKDLNMYLEADRESMPRPPETGDEIRMSQAD